MDLTHALQSFRAGLPQFGKAAPAPDRSGDAPVPDKAAAAPPPQAAASGAARGGSGAVAIGRETAGRQPDRNCAPRHSVRPGKWHGGTRRRISDCAAANDGASLREGLI